MSGGKLERIKHRTLPRSDCTDWQNEPCGTGNPLDLETGGALELRNHATTCLAICWQFAGHSVEKHQTQLYDCQRFYESISPLDSGRTASESHPSESLRQAVSQGLVFLEIPA